MTNRKTKPTEWRTEAHTGLPLGFTLQRRVLSDLKLAEYRLSFECHLDQTVTLEAENTSDIRDILMRHMLAVMVQYIKEAIRPIEKLEVGEQ